MRAHQAGISPATYAAVFVGLEIVLAALCFAVAGVLMWRRPHDRMAWLAAAILICLGGTYSGADALAARDEIVLVSFASWLETLGLVLFLLFLYVYPGGRFVPRWMLWPMIGSAAVIAGIRSDLVRSWNLPTAELLFLLALPPVTAQVYRYRTDSGIAEQQQTKWVAYGILMAVAANLLSNVADAVFGVVGGVAPAVKLVLEAFAYIGMLLVPLTLGAAVLRHRLFDVNVIIRRTLQYTVVAMLLILAYTGLVLVLQETLVALTGRGESISVVLATLAVAALFNPLRQRVRDWVDRRFYRSVYHSEEVVAAFGRMAQNEGDLNLLTEELMDAVRSALKPSFASLWLAQVKVERQEEPFQ
jgi:hypothetical protein